MRQINWSPKSTQDTHTHQHTPSHCQHNIYFHPLLHWTPHKNFTPTPLQNIKVACCQLLLIAQQAQCTRTFPVQQTLHIPRQQLNQEESKRTGRWAGRQTRLNKFSSKTASHSHYTKCQSQSWLLKPLQCTIEAAQPRYSIKADSPFSSHWWNFQLVSLAWPQVWRPHGLACHRIPVKHIIKGIPLLWSPNTEALSNLFLSALSVTFPTEIHTKSFSIAIPNQLVTDETLIYHLTSLMNVLDQLTSVEIFLPIKSTKYEKYWQNFLSPLAFAAS